MQGLMYCEKIQTLGWEFLMHPSYSLDISSTDYHLFLSLDNLLLNEQLKNREAVEKALESFFTSRGRDFYKNVINK